jgi:hypothetical protein
MKKRIHVNQHNIRANKVDQKACRPVITCKTYKGNYTCNHVWIDGPSVVMYEPDNPLKCGARVWIETDSDVVLDGRKRIS